MNRQILLDVTSSAFTGDAGHENLLECRKACEQHGFTFGIQLHNTATAEEIERIVGFGVPMSAHAPLLSEYAVNLAAEDAGLSLTELQRNAEIMRRHKMNRAVFHGFMMTDLPVPAFGRGRSYDECLGLIFRGEMSIDGTSRICGDFLNTEELARYLEVDLNSIMEWANSGKVPGHKEGNDWKFERKAIDSWVASGKIEK